jgi:hypothetical protein
MRVSGSSGTAFGTAFSARASVYQEAEDSPTAGRDLVPQQPAFPAPQPPAPSARPLAPFLAQLLAAADHMPASRARRRADPADGARSYRAAENLVRNAEGKSLREA